MADNVDITAGTGTTIHADEYTHTTLGAGKTQLVKLADGTLDAEAAIAADIGVKANALRVAPANDITDGTYIGDIKFAEALPAGTAAIGKLAANSGVDIGDVDVTSVPAPLNVVGGGTEAAALRVTVANDSTGVVTVDGTVTANLSATDNAVLDAIAASVASADGKITACNTGAVVLAAGANAIGKLAANSGVDIGDVDVTSCANTSGDVAHDTGDSGNPIKVGGKAVSFDGTVPGTAVAEADRTNFITDLYGRQYVETAHPRYFNARADYGAAQTNATVQAAAGAGLKLYITDIMISNGATAGNITLLDGSGGTVIWEIYTAINGGCVANFKTPIVLTANTLLAITSTTVTTHSIAVQGYIAP